MDVTMSGETKHKRFWFVAFSHRTRAASIREDHMNYSWAILICRAAGALDQESHEAVAPIDAGPAFVDRKQGIGFQLATVASVIRSICQGERNGDDAAENQATLPLISTDLY